MRHLSVQAIKIRTPDGFLLRGTLRTPRGSRRAIIFCHGMTVGRDDEGIFVRVEPLLNALGYSTLRFDFRAHGRSQGGPVRDFTVTGQLTDLQAACHFLGEEQLEIQGIIAASFGASIAAIHVGRFLRGLQILVLANPVLSYRHLFLSPDTPWARTHFLDFRRQLDEQGFVRLEKSTFKIGPVLFREADQYDPADELSKFRGHLLIIHGDCDTKISLLHSVRCFRALSNPKKTLRIVNGAEHGFHTEPHETRVVEMIHEYVREVTLQGTS
ncbi:alpha/beta fold hydrolase [Candidatus Bipolaricaulota bacterium]|nr:alpha/beta fold hydrolase [Candidatus Bipolaricaulota bacterium]